MSTQCKHAKVNELTNSLTTEPNKLTTKPWFLVDTYGLILPQCYNESVL